MEGEQVPQSWMAMVLFIFFKLGIEDEGREYRRKYLNSLRSIVRNFFILVVIFVIFAFISLIMS